MKALMAAAISMTTTSLTSMLLMVCSRELLLERRVKARVPVDLVRVEQVVREVADGVVVDGGRVAAAVVVAVNL
jgi:hypothetical protein